ncbi:MAG: hypothetical protein MJ246_05205 [Clostridia bacterium]|nr:hypothetical protein [Clostridia bacterium]
MAKTIIGCIIFLVVIVAIILIGAYLYAKFSVVREYKGKVVDISNCVTIVNNFEPGLWGVVVVEDEDGHTNSYCANLTMADQLIVGKEYIFVTVNDKLMDVKKAG